MSKVGNVLAPLLLFLVWPLALAFGHAYAIFRSTKHRNQPVKKVQQFIYNAKLRTVFNKDSSSWIRTIVYYVIFTTALALYVGVLGGFCVLIIDKDYPMKQGMQNMIKGNPGLAYKPMPDKTTNLIRFVQGNADSYTTYTNDIIGFLAQYENNAQVGNDFQDCQNIKLEDRDPKKVCSFKIETLGKDCQDNKDFGYDIGTPCILIKMNKIYGWKPENYTNQDIPYEIKDRYTPDHLTITCQGESPADQENMGKVNYFPSHGLPFIYFPFLNQEGYRQPVMFVKFERPRNGVLIQVSCRIWASNIYHHITDRAGSIHFELLVD